MLTKNNKRIAVLAALLAFAGTAAASEVPGGVIKPAHNDVTNVASRLQVRSDLLAPTNGLLHGGALVTLADSACGASLGLPCTC